MRPSPRSADDGTDVRQTQEGDSKRTKPFENGVHGPRERRRFADGPRPITHIYGKLQSHMKTTLDLPDELFVAAKKRAAEQRRPLRDLVAAGLRTELQAPPRATRSRRAITWVTVKGGLPEGTDVADRDAMHDRLRFRR